MKSAIKSSDGYLTSQHWCYLNLSLYILTPATEEITLIKLAVLHLYRPILAYMDVEKDQPFPRFTHGKIYSSTSSPFSSICGRWMLRKVDHVTV